MRQPTSEKRDHSRIRRPSILPGPVKVEEAQSDSGGFVCCTGDPRMQLACGLVCALRADRGHWSMFTDRNVSAVAIDRRRRSVNNRNCAAVSIAPRSIQNIERAGQIDLVCAQQVSVRSDHRGNCGQVEASIDPRESLFNGRRSVTSPYKNSICGGRLCRCPLDRSSRTRTRWPCLTNASTRCEPTKPAPPVTRKRAIQHP